MDDTTDKKNSMLMISLSEFFASDGWRAMKLYVKDEGLFRCSPQSDPIIQSDILEEIWFWYLSQCIDLGVLLPEQVKCVLRFVPSAMLNPSRSNPSFPR
jgi:hypothetical protein